MRVIQGVDAARLEPYLSATIDDYDPAVKLTIEPLSGGRSNLTYRLTQAGRHWVLRRPPLGHVMPSAHDMEREFRMLRYLAHHGFPAPRPIAYCDDSAVLGTPFQVMEYVPGLVVSDEAAASRLGDADASHLSEQLIRSLVRLHGIPPPAVAAGRSTSSRDYLRRQLTRWVQQWQNTKTRELPAFSRLSQWLEDALNGLSADHGITVVHGDYRIDNLVIDPVSKDIRAVLDWEMSTLGDPVMDLALLLVYWQQPGDTQRARVAVMRNVTTAAGFWSRARLAGEYARRAPYSAGRPHLDACLALACLKLAVIMESVHYRYLAGQTVDDLSAGLRQAAPALLEMGLSVAEGNGIQGLSV